MVAFALALLFLAGSVGYVVGSRSADSAGGRRDADSAEVGFLLDMIAHHEQAIEMSRVALAASMPVGVESFAIEVVADQQYEVGVMEALLHRWGHPRQDGDDLSMGWMGAPVADDRMPGLASPEAMASLADARGDEAAAWWLSLMTNHHEGGVHMADAAVERVSDPYVKALAERMARNQAMEINEYASARRRNGLAAPDDPGKIPVPPSEDGGEHGGDDHG